MNKMNTKSILAHAKDFNKVRKEKKKKKTIRKRLNKILKKTKYTEKFKKENKIRSIMN